MVGSVAKEHCAFHSAMTLVTTRAGCNYSFWLDFIGSEVRPTEPSRVSERNQNLELAGGTNRPRESAAGEIPQQTLSVPPQRHPRESRVFLDGVCCIQRQEHHYR